jgi:hypothetical protein
VKILKPFIEKKIPDLFSITLLFKSTKLYIQCKYKFSHKPIGGSGENLTIAGEAEIIFVD